MRRLALIVLLLAAVVTGTARTAHAAVPCRDKIYNDWYANGKIETTFPIACYRDALKHVPADARIYSSLSDDIQSALQGALGREQGKKNVPAEIGKGKVSLTKGAGAVAGTTKTLKPEPASPPSQPGTLASGETTGGGGIPTPILVLGAVAILLAAAGATGAGVRHFRGR